ncbi:hypothetical protein [Kribbella sp. CA-293567]|uniref:hypothetical protein n=1 Tax=Kribbella sp. CA-293567 TaxID=3002436 RepID=UPI0022DDD015|nr:hypothetical protein [Kribbella sp. CA-293567]WBQ03403.1 hypothetical protein OX958_25935 [Kribbella sp. CA-293567]
MRITRSLLTAALVTIGALTPLAAPVAHAGVPSESPRSASVEAARPNQAVQSQDASTGLGVGITAQDLAKKTTSTVAPKLAGWSTPTARSYYLTSSCRPWASAIRSGAAAWSRLSEGGGTPVSCQNTFISGCGGTRVVGCNWGQGQRISLYLGYTRDPALLAAHEFGHNWYGHSTRYRCSGWSSPDHVMGPNTCS